jgi:dihydroorotate dehydrogenase (fumarate)
LTASALLRRGPMYAAALLDGLAGWMSRKGFGTLAQVRGLLAMPAGADGSARERAGYVTALRAANVGNGQW